MSPTPPRTSRAALKVIADSGRAALTELQRLLGVLRDDQEQAIAPQPRSERDRQRRSKARRPQPRPRLPTRNSHDHPDRTTPGHPDPVGLPQVNAMSQCHLSPDGTRLPLLAPAGLPPLELPGAEADQGPGAPADAGYPVDRGVDQDRPGGPRALGRPPSPAGRRSVPAAGPDHQNLPRPAGRRPHRRLAGGAL